jgi:plasmid rolling circle replication initiator protein Rep
MSHKKWMDMWRDCMGLDYDPWVDIRTVKPFDTLSEDGTIRYNKAVAEVAKYTAKPSDYIVMWVNKGQVKRGSDADAWAKRQCEEMTDKAVSVMDAALHGRRLIAFGGKLRDVHKLLNLDDPADGDLINTDNEEKKDDFLQFVVAKFYWNVGIGNYVLVKNTDSDNES